MKRLYRSESDRMLGGVCAGLGLYFDIDPTLVRLAFAGAFLLGFGSPGLLYLLLWLIMPLETRLDEQPPRTLETGVEEIGAKARQVAGKIKEQISTERQPE